MVHGGQVLAESAAPCCCARRAVPVRYYLPPEDVRTDLLTPSDTHTHCPFKGTPPTGRSRTRPTSSGRYPEPKPDVAAIKDHFCFYEVEVS